VLLYDDRCGFCRRWVARLKRWDRRDRIGVMSLWDTRAPGLAGRSADALRHAAHVVMPSGEVHAGAAALRALCPVLPGGRLVAGLFALPGAMALAERSYRWVARRWGPVGGGERGA